MNEAVKQLAITIIFVGIAHAGGRKLDAQFMGIYGSSYCASSFIQWFAPKVSSFNNWLSWIEKMGDKIF